MAVREIALLGDPILRIEVSKDWRDRFDEAAIERVAADMTETMRAVGGVGIAAPQIGEAARLIAIEIRADNRYGVSDLLELMLIRDPEIEVTGPATVETWEGCLSLPTLRGPVTRSRCIVLRGEALDGTPIEISMSDFAAVVAQHEVDHVDGVLFIDRMRNLELLSFEAEFHRYHEHSLANPDSRGETRSDERS